jgi:hypothetical protein
LTAGGPVNAKRGRLALREPGGEGRRYRTGGREPTAALDAGLPVRGALPSSCGAPWCAVPGCPWFWSDRAPTRETKEKEAALNGPCPCGSGKTAHLCCFTRQGWQWHKQPAILGLKTLPPAGRVEKCYMKELGSCVPPISGEHIPWLEAGETKIIAPPQVNCLCRKHNSSLTRFCRALLLLHRALEWVILV